MVPAELERLTERATGIHGLWYNFFSRRRHSGFFIPNTPSALGTHSRVRLEGIVTVPLDNTSRDEFNLVRQVCAGDGRAAGELLTILCRPTIAAVARHYGESAIELTDQLFIHLHASNWRRLRTWNGEGSIKAWISIVASRLCRELKGRSASVPLPSSGDHRELSDPNEDVLNTLINEERWMGVLKAIENLSNAKYRFVLRRYYVEGEELAKIASELNISMNAVYVTRNRAIGMLKHQVLEGRTKNVASGC